VSIFVIDAEQDLGKKIIPYEEGTTLFLSSWRKLDPSTVPIEAKAAANYLNGMVARKEAQKKGFEYAVMLDTQGYIAEGGTESAFLVKDNKLMTAATGTVLKSISRMSILEAAKIAGIECFEGQLKPELLFEADEIFLSCTPSKVLPVLKINDRELEHAPGPLTQKIAEMLDRIYSGDDERFKDWMYPVL
jgi:branched-chain amino acid aminotransferase